MLLYSPPGAELHLVSVRSKFLRRPQPGLRISAHPGVPENLTLEPHPLGNPFKEIYLWTSEDVHDDFAHRVVTK